MPAIQSHVLSILKIDQQKSSYIRSTVTDANTARSRPNHKILSKILLAKKKTGKKNSNTAASYNGVDTRLQLFNVWKSTKCKMRTNAFVGKFINGEGWGTHFLQFRITASSSSSFVRFCNSNQRKKTKRKKRKKRWWESNFLLENHVSTLCSGKQFKWCHLLQVWQQNCSPWGCLDSGKLELENSPHKQSKVQSIQTSTAIFFFFFF